MQTDLVGGTGVDRMTSQPVKKSAIGRRVEMHRPKGPQILWC